MSHTNQTPNYHLPQFLGTDKPAWLADFNQAMSDIDTQMKANATAGATAEANAQSALSGLSATNTQVSGLQTDVTAIQTQMPLDEAQIATNTQNISTQASAIVNANNRIDTANGNITALNTKVGNLTDLDTTDKTSIVNAVNEVKAEVDAGKVSTFGTSVEVTSYIEGTSRFTCPSDGYCEIHTNNVDQTVTLYINGVGVATVYGTASTRYDRTPVYVRKGMQLSVTSSSNGYAYYIPIAE